MVSKSHVTNDISFLNKASGVFQLFIMDRFVNTMYHKVYINSSDCENKYVLAFVFPLTQY